MSKALYGTQDHVGQNLSSGLGWNMHGLRAWGATSAQHHKTKVV